MPDLEIDPGDYRERKPKGWRWRLPWSHPVSARTPFVGMLLMLGFVAYGPGAALHPLLGFTLWAAVTYLLLRFFRLLLRHRQLLLRLCRPRKSRLDPVL